MSDDAKTDSDSYAERVKKQDEDERQARIKARRGQTEQPQGTEPTEPVEPDEPDGAPA